MFQIARRSPHTANIALQSVFIHCWMFYIFGIAWWTHMAASTEHICVRTPATRCNASEDRYRRSPVACGKRIAFRECCPRRCAHKHHSHRNVLSLLFFFLCCVPHRQILFFHNWGNKNRGINRRNKRGQRKNTEKKNYISKDVVEMVHIIMMWLLIYGYESMYFSYYIVLLICRLLLRLLRERIF